MSVTSDLQAAHSHLLDALEVLEAALASEVPDRAMLANARWKLSRASGMRRKLLVETVYPLIEAAGGAGAARVAALRREDGEMSAASARHVATWTLDAVLADWPGYRAASATMRQAMQARVAAERAILYPLVAALGQPA